MNGLRRVVMPTAASEHMTVDVSAPRLEKVDGPLPIAVHDRAPRGSDHHAATVPHPRQRSALPLSQTERARFCR